MVQYFVNFVIEVMITKNFVHVHTCTRILAMRDHENYLYENLGYSQ